MDIIDTFGEGEIEQVYLVFVCPQQGGIETLQPLHITKGRNYASVTAIPLKLRNQFRFHETQYIIRIPTSTIQEIP